MKIRSLASLAAIAFFGFRAFAAQDVCQTFLVCGTYKMNWQTKDAKPAVTTLTVKSIGPNKAHLDYISEVNGQKDEGIQLDMTFEDNGNFKLVLTNPAYAGQNYANGVCSDKICTYGMHPWTVDGHPEAIANAGMFRFKDGKVEYLLTYGTPTEYKTDLQIFTKE